MQHQQLLKKQAGVLQQLVVDAETKLLKQKESLGETERKIEELDDSLADLWQSVDKEMFSAKEDRDSESSDDPTRGLGGWFKVVNIKKNRRFEKPFKAMLLEKELVKVANNMPRSQFLRITRKASWDIEGPALDMDLCTTTQSVSPQVPSTLLDNEAPEVLDNPFGNDLNDLVSTPVGWQRSRERNQTDLNLSSDFNDRFKREPFLKDNFVVAGIPVHSGNADLAASGTPVCSAVETDFLKEVSDSSAVVSEPEPSLRGAGANPRLCRDHAATAGGAAPPLAVVANSRLRRDRAAPAGCAAELFGARVPSRVRRDLAAPALF